MTNNIKITGLDEVISDIVNLPRDAKLANRKAMTTAGLFLRGQVERRWKVDTGFSRSRIEFDIDTGKLSADLNVGFLDKEVDYAYFVEKGRAPGKFPPLQSIVGWLGGKKDLQAAMIQSFYPSKSVPLIQRQSEYESLTSQQKGLVFIIGRAIAKKGTKGAFAFRDTRAQNLGQAEQVYLNKLVQSLNLLK